MRVLLSPTTPHSLLCFESPSNPPPPLPFFAVHIALHVHCKNIWLRCRGEGRGIPVPVKCASVRDSIYFKTPVYRTPGHSSPLHTTRVPTARPEANGADRRLTLPPLPASPCEVCVRACVRVCVRCVCCVRACARVLRLQSSVKPSLFLCDRSFPFFKKKNINRGACGCRLAHTWFQSIPGCGRQE